MWCPSAQNRAKRLRAIGVLGSALKGHRARTAQVGLCGLSCHRPGQSTQSTHSTRRGGQRPVGPCACVQVLRPLAPFPPKRPLRLQQRCIGPRQAGWVTQESQLLNLLVPALGLHTMAGTNIHAYDTSVPVLKPGRGKTKTERLWVYVRNNHPFGSSEPPAAWSPYTPEGKGEHPQLHLQQ